MGCVGSRKSENPLENSLRAEIARCNLEEFNGGFDSVQDQLTAADAIRTNILNFKKQLIRMTFPLKENVSLIEAFTIFCWTLSASYEGDIKSSKLEVVNDPPFIKAELSWLDAEQRQFFKLLQAYITAVLEAPEQLKQQKKELDQQYRDLENKQREAIRKANADKMEIRSNTEANLQNIQICRDKLSSFTKFLENERSYLRGSFVSQMKAIIKEADINGKVAAEQNHKTLEKVSQHYEIPAHKYRYAIFV